MTFKVYVQSHRGQYRAVCGRLGLEVLDPEKSEALRKINAMIKKTVDDLEAKGLPLPPEPPKPISLGTLDGQKSSCKGKGCGSAKKIIAE